MKRNDLTGKKFGEWEVKEYLGNKKYRCICSCGVEKEVSAYKLTSGQSKSCGHASGNQFIDLTGLQFNSWTALKYEGDHKWLCKCSCGTEKLVPSNYLRTGKSKSCGHDTTGFKDITGMKFNSWTALEYLGGTIWRCKCDCGKEGKVKLYDLINGRSKSCGHDYNEFKDLTGMQFGNWSVIRYLGDQMWECKCSCGTIRNIQGEKLKLGLTKSCGCKSQEIQEETNLKKYGVPFSAQKHLTKEQVAIASSKITLEAAIINNFDHKPTPKELSELLGLQVHRTMVKVYEYGLEYLIDLNKPVSSYENELNNLYPCNNRSDRKVLNGKEIDLYYPEYNLGIEFNGSYWHSALVKDMLYHQNKTLNAIKCGINLIQIFEYEWLDKDIRQKIINLLDSRLKPEKLIRIMGRKCVIQEVSLDESREFLEKYHLQGYASASINVGCYYNNELIGLMTFGIPRFNTNYEYEIIRLCWKDHIVVNGGTQRMFKYFISKYNPNSVITYCNLSKFNGSVYKKIGFTLDKITKPNYVWVKPDSNKVLTRYKTMKHKLIEKGLGTEDQTEDEIMENLGYLKIYDCGNVVYIWNKGQ
ncbi:MAG: hypothetical protein IJ593_00835 [Lachnospiraceae bacterium]|nr:hypothetical protein [Lachnospiraceae bacterium]